MKENRCRIQGVFADGNLNYTLFGEFFCANPGAKLPIPQTGRVFFEEARRNVGHEIFIGPRLWIGTSTLPFERIVKMLLTCPILDFTPTSFRWALWSLVMPDQTAFTRSLEA
jgi:hypothetical protein